MGFFNFLFRRNNEEPDLQDFSRKAPSGPDPMEEIEVEPGTTLPRALADHWELLKTTVKPTIRITATPAKDLDIRASKFGAYPCIPIGFEYPVEPNGMQLFPLAQINCRELPKPNPFPESGYIQFYIPISDYLYEIDKTAFNTLQPGYKVIYFTEEETAEHVTDFAFMYDVLEKEEAPFRETMKLEFTTATDLFGTEDFRCREPAERMGEMSRIFDKLDGKLADKYIDQYAGGGHKMGGYAFFAQSDPRQEEPAFRQYEQLLLQIDSDDHIEWGDGGVANFFIRPHDLARKDFSQVFFTWDCF